MSQAASRRSSRWYAKGRAWARANLGKLDHLTSAAVEWSGNFTVTHWRGVAATRSASAGDPGEGAEVPGTIEEHYDARAAYAGRVVEKKGGDAVAHGTSEWGGSSDAEATSRTGILLDCDAGINSFTGWSGLLRVLKALRLAYIAQRRASGRFHIEIPLAQPIPVTGADKTAWSCQLGWALGIFAEIAFSRDDSLGFDPLTDRLLQLVFLYARRSEDEVTPTTEMYSGPLALDWFAFLQATEFPTAEADADTGPALSVVPDPAPSEPPSAEALARAAAHLAKIPAAIEGQNGHDALWKATLAAARGFNLPVAWACELLQREYNPRCSPPWTEREILHKVSDAARSTQVPAGYLLDEGKRLAEEFFGNGNNGNANLPIIRLGVDEYRCIDESVGAIAKHPSLYWHNSYLAEVMTEESPTRACPACSGSGESGEHDCQACRGSGREIDPGVDVSRGIGTPYARQVPPPRLREIVTASAALEKFNERAKDWVPAHPTEWLVNGLHARGRWPGVRKLIGIGDSPVFLPDGDIPTSPGYHEKSGLHISSDVILSVPDRPTRADAEAAAARVLELVDEFPFVEGAHRAAWLCSLLTVLSRFAFRGPAPITFVEASTAGSGKSKLVDLVSIIAFGRVAARSSYSQDEEEMRKKITTVVRDGDRLVLFDDIENGSLFKSSALQRVTTGDVWVDRLLGSNDSFRSQVYTTWFVSGNNLTIGGDLGRRIMHVRLTPLVERPELRSGFKIERIESYAREHRAKLLSACFTVLRAFHLAGRPDAGLPAWGSFEDWSALPRAATVWAGLPDPGSVRQALASAADQGHNAGAELVRAVAELLAEKGAASLSAKEILDAIASSATFHGGSKHSGLRSALEELCNTKDGQRPSPRMVGWALRKLRDRVFGSRVLVTDGEDRNGIKWKVVDVVDGG